VRDAQRPRRLEDVHRSLDVDAHARHRVGAAERHLQRREVHDPLHPVALHHLPNRLAVGQVALLERHPGERLGVHERLETPAVGGEVEGDGHVPSLEQVLDRPGA